MDDNKDKPQQEGEPSFRTAAEVAGMDVSRGSFPNSGLSQSPGLRELPDSKVPGTARGDVSHVYGPGQAPVDPVAAGLDLKTNPPTRSENRVVTQTGEAAAGPRPFTYIEKTGPDQVQQAAPADGKHVPAQPEADAEKAPGPNSASAVTAPVGEKPPTPAAPKGS